MTKTQRNEKLSGLVARVFLRWTNEYGLLNTFKAGLTLLFQNKIFLLKAIRLWDTGFVTSCLTYFEDHEDYNYCAKLYFYTFIRNFEMQNYTHSACNMQKYVRRLKYSSFYNMFSRDYIFFKDLNLHKNPRSIDKTLKLNFLGNGNFIFAEILLLFISVQVSN